MVEIFDDIRKAYQFVTPCDELAGHIEFFSESMPVTYGDAADRKDLRQFSSVKMFPSWTPTCWINPGTPYYLSVSSKIHFIDSGEK